LAQATLALSRLSKSVFLLKVKLYNKYEP
jgi:hypothetical protein